MQINTGVREELMHVAAARINTCVVSPSGSRAALSKGGKSLSLVPQGKNGGFIFYC